eukprot:299547-Pyramimonas_sp.AAC.1
MLVQILYNQRWAGFRGEKRWRRGELLPQRCKYFWTDLAVNQAFAVTTLGDIAFQIVDDLHRWSSRSDDAILQREEKAETSNGASNTYIAQRHKMILADRDLPFWLELISFFNCMGGCKHDSNTYEISVVIKVETQFVGEYLTIDPNERQFDSDVIRDAPPGLRELIDQIWDQPFNRVPAHGRWGR